MDKLTGIQMLQSSQSPPRKSIISANKMLIGEDYISNGAGILNAIVSASAQYLFKVIERETNRGDTKWFDKDKLRRLQRTIIHKNGHLDEYCAELLFRAILPPYMKDLEIKDHILISRNDDIFAKLTWSNAVVFGIGAEEAGGAKALQVFNEHRKDGTRVRPSCSQLVADEFLGKIPKSIQIVLDDVNNSDSKRGAHQYNLKNVITAMHDTLFTVGYDELGKHEINKYLSENWKRAIIDACIVAMVYAYQNGIYSQGNMNEDLKIAVEKKTKGSLDYFLEHSFLRKNESFEGAKGSLLYHFRVGNHATIDKAIWQDELGKEIGKQILVISRICYALERCWGRNIGLFIMMHIWQCIFHQQILFNYIRGEIKDLPNDKARNTKFGSIRKIQISSPGFQPEQRAGDKRKRNLNAESPLWLIEANVIDPSYFNTATAIKAMINDAYAGGGNNGFGLFLLHDKTLNAKVLNTGSTIPFHVWKNISDTLVDAEPERWFQLVDSEGSYADFVLNRTKAHQEHLPSTDVTIDFLKRFIEKKYQHH